jgi:hypothetical protein
LLLDGARGKGKQPFLVPRALCFVLRLTACPAGSRLQESRELAVQSVYAPAVLDSLSKVSRKLVEKPEVLELDEEYLKNAGRVAQVRAAQAAIRLGTVMRVGLE